MLILGIETSCDETAAAVVHSGRMVKSNIIASQAAEHSSFGGVVPELASRRHVENIVEVTKAAIKDSGYTQDDIEAVAVTYAPGLIGALLVGVNFAKAYAYAIKKPLIPVHHLRAHIAALYLEYPELQPPFICLVASGGHSHIINVLGYTNFEILGRTVDDAAGEAFDKIARILDLGYPGGPAVAKAALFGDPNRYTLPTPKAPGEFDVSFSGLKTAVINLKNTLEMRGEKVCVNSLAAAFENKTADILSVKLKNAARKINAKIVCLVGGVAANEILKNRIKSDCDHNGQRFCVPTKDLCGDNGAMVASAGYYEYLSGNIAALDLNGKPTKEII